MSEEQNEGPGYSSRGIDKGASSHIETREKAHISNELGRCQLKESLDRPSK